MARKRKRVFIDPSKLVYDPLYYDNKDGDEENAGNANTANTQTDKSANNDVKLDSRDAVGMHGAAGISSAGNGGKAAGPKHRLGAIDDDSDSGNLDIKPDLLAKKANTEPRSSNEPSRINSVNSANSVNNGLDRNREQHPVHSETGDSGIHGVQKQSRLDRPDIVSRGSAPTKDRDHEQRERCSEPDNSREVNSRAQETAAGDRGRGREGSGAVDMVNPDFNSLTPPDLPSSAIADPTTEEIDLILLSSEEEEEVIDLLSSEDSSDFESIMIISQQNKNFTPASATASTSTTGSTSTIISQPPVPQKQPSEPLPEPCTLHVHCIIPHKEERTDLVWPRMKSFYDLESRFGTQAVIFFNNHEVKPFSSPAIQAPTELEMDLIICTREQFYKLRMGEINAENVISGVQSTPNSATQPAEAPQSKAFPITLEGKPGTVRVQVHLETKLSAVADHFRREKKITEELRFKFDGDELSLDSTVADAEIEEDDKLEVYVVNRT